MKSASKFSTAGAALLVATMSLSAPALAQVTEVSRTPVNDGARITFGYLCDDRFVIRNDGDKAVDLEYAIEKGNEHTKLSVNAHEVVELNSKSRNAMELWMDGKLVAKAPKDKRSCKNVQGNGSVNVTPLEVNDGSDRDRDYYRYGLGSPYGFYDPFAFRFSRFGLWGGYPYYYSPIIRVPVIVNRGGPHRGR